MNKDNKPNKKKTQEWKGNFQRLTEAQVGQWMVDADRSIKTNVYKLNKLKGS